MAWSRFCTETPGYCHHISSTHHSACPHCSEANPNPVKAESVGETPEPEFVDLCNSPPAFQSTHAAPSCFVMLDEQSNEAHTKSITQTKKSNQATPNAGSLIHSAREPAHPPIPLSSQLPQASMLKVELQITLNEIKDYALQTYDNTAWNTICQYNLH